MSDANEHLVFITSCLEDKDGAITAYRLNAETAGLEPVERNADIENPFYLALSPDRKFLYTAHVPGDFENDSGYVTAFEIVGDSGVLRKVNERSAKGRTTCYVDVDPTGKAVVFANYSSGSVGSFPVRPDGSLGEMVSFIQHQGASMVNPDRQEAAHAHCAVISANSRQVYVCDLGLDQIVGYGLDASFAELTPLEQPYVRTLGGGGPRHFTYHPQGRYVYANNELASSVNAYSYNEETGLLIERQVISTLPEGFDGQNSTADIKATPNGRFLYCSNRGHDSIAIYAIDDDGTLALVDIQPSLGHIAQNLAITPDGSLLLCANMIGTDDGKGENVAVFRIDADSGKLSPAGEPVAHARPSCIVIR